MALLAVTSSDRRFRTVRFKPGFNLVLANKSPGSTTKDSRNGVGKTTLIEIIDFCLGGNPSEDQVLGSPELANWDFTLELTLRGEAYSVTRSLADASSVMLKGDFSKWPLKPDYDPGEEAGTMPLDRWR